MKTQLKILKLLVVVLCSTFTATSAGQLYSINTEGQTVIFINAVGLTSIGGTLTKQSERISCTSTRNSTCAAVP